MSGRRSDTPGPSEGTEARKAANTRPKPTKVRLLWLVALRAPGAPGVRALATKRRSTPASVAEAAGQRRLLSSASVSAGLSYD
jgi:hypothetical protein